MEEKVIRVCVLICFLENISKVAIFISICSDVHTYLDKNLFIR